MGSLPTSLRGQDLYPLDWTKQDLGWHPRGNSSKQEGWPLGERATLLGEIRTLLCPDKILFIVTKGRYSKSCRPTKTDALAHRRKVRLSLSLLSSLYMKIRPDRALDFVFSISFFYSEHYYLVVPESLNMCRSSLNRNLCHSMLRFPFAPFIFLFRLQS